MVVWDLNPGAVRGRPNYTNAASSLDPEYTGTACYLVPKARLMEGLMEVS